MQRAATDKVRGRGRASAAHNQVRHARVLIVQRAVADGRRSAAQRT
jgi:hypothetical protein